MTLSAFAYKYAEATGCDMATAEQATFVAATLLADMVGRRDIGDYFSGRASEMESKKDGTIAVPFQAEPIDLEHGTRIPANDRIYWMYSRLREFQK